MKESFTDNLVYQLYLIEIKSEFIILDASRERAVNEGLSTH